MKRNDDYNISNYNNFQILITSFTVEATTYITVIALPLNGSLGVRIPVTTIVKTDEAYNFTNDTIKSSTI